MKPAAVLLVLAPLCAAAENWPQFRGPRGDGTSAEAFGGARKIKWKTKLPGPGHASPVVWGDRIFLTAFEPESSALRRLGGWQGRLWVLCFRRADGALLWQREVEAKEIEKTTNVNKPASPTPAVDGQRVYVYFGSVGLAAFTLDGKQEWVTKIGPFPHHMGFGGSPILAGDRILLNVESDGPSFLYSINKSNGSVQWRVPRKTRQAAYSSPVVWGSIIAVAGHESVMAYSLADGRHQWTVSGLSTYVVPTPVPADDGLLFATSNGPGGNVVMALRQSGEVAWSATRGGAYVASPVVARRIVFTVNQNCVVTALDAAKGAVQWQRRLPTQGECFASPVVTAGGEVFFATTAGEVMPLSGGAGIELGERILASPAISGGEMYVRAESHLMALVP